MEVFDAPTHYYQSDALSLDELAYWVAFSRILGIGPIRFKLLLDYFHEDIAAAWKADSKELAQAGLDTKTIDGFLKQRTTSKPQQELEKLERLRIRVLTLKDKDYPDLLKELINAPPVLYIAGTFKKEEDRFALGIVGTRKVSSYGRQVTEQFARELAEGKVTVVSGLAHGIDTIAHTATLDAGGRTLAVLASGLDTIYPADNLGLARRIVESGQGALVTEFPLGIKPDGRNFPARNRPVSFSRRSACGAPLMRPVSKRNSRTHSGVVDIRVAHRSNSTTNRSWSPGRGRPFTETVAHPQPRKDRRTGRHEPLFG